VTVVTVVVEYVVGGVMGIVWWSSASGPMTL
jgi:hypothetical protein